MAPGDYPLVDVLNIRPAWRIDAQVLDTQMVFCFSGSSSGGLFVDALASASLPPSSFEPECFAQDLFLERFVRDCLKGPGALVTLKHLTRLIAYPPSDIATIEMRRDILAELEQRADLVASLRDLHHEVLRFRNELEGTGPGRERGSNHRQQLDVLDAFSKIVEFMRTRFGAATSALQRLSEFGQKVAVSEGYESLTSLLSYDQKQATLDFRVQIGADGRVRHLELLHIKEEKKNPFYHSSLRGLGIKLELLLRGFRFSDGEVMSRLVDAVFEGVRPFFPCMVQLLGDIEFYLGALHFKARAEAAGLKVCLPEFCSSDSPRQLVDLFNPLLLGSGVKPVPCSIDTDRLSTTLLITGPNSGGKTRLLQSVGLLQLLGQSGIFVPASAARIALARGLVVSLIQETYADQSEGRLGMELMRIRALFERLPVGAIVILDELCSGTNPSEGEEIFELVVNMLEKLKPQAFITTHFLEFAARLERQKRIEGLRFLQVELGVDQEPTYQFTQGVAKSSLAHQAASRLGVTGDQLLLLIDRKLREQV